MQPTTQPLDSMLTKRNFENSSFFNIKAISFIACAILSLISLTIGILGLVHLIIAPVGTAVLITLISGTVLTISMIYLRSMWKEHVKAQALQPKVVAKLETPSARVTTKAKPKVKGLEGLQNHGNDCFINAFVQFAKRSPLIQRLVAASTTDRAKVLKEILDNYENQPNTKTLRKPFGFNPGSQEDSSEILTRLLSVLEESKVDTSDKIAMSYLVEVEGTYHIQIEKRYGLYLTLPLSHAQSSKKLEEIITTLHPKAFPEAQNLIFSKAHEELIISLERFVQSKEKRSSSKINTDLEIPKDLSFLKENVEFQDSPDKDIHYRLDAFITHHGTSLRGGHYIACIEIEGQWYRCSDESCIAISEAKLQKELGQATMLHYRKVG